ncbi:Hsp70 family protein [Patescibacteria group bacterium]
MVKLAYGVDFGTTNSAIGVLSSGGDPIVIPVDANGSKMMPSILYFPNEERGVHIGEGAISEYLEWRDGRFIQSIKTILPSRTFTGTRIGFDVYEAADLVALILERLKEIGDRFTGKDIRRAVFGRPVQFSFDHMDDRRAENRLREAAEIAGFEEVRFQPEPVAAALAFEISLKKPCLALVADFGGGTSDFTLVHLGPNRLTKSDRSSDVIASCGLSLAGDAFDARLMSAKIKGLFGGGSTHAGFLPGKRLPIPSTLLSDLCNKGRVISLYNEGVRDQLASILRTTDDPDGINRLIKLVDYNLGYSIFSVIERGKKELSSEDSTRLHFDEKGINVDTTVFRDEFEHLIAGDVVRLANCVDLLLRDAGVTADQINAVYPTGGSSLVPAVRRMLAGKFGENKLAFSKETFLSVVTGLTLSTNYLFTE